VLCLVPAVLTLLDSTLQPAARKSAGASAKGAKSSGDAADLFAQMKAKKEGGKK
jgi:hypothetical protein